MIAHGFVVVVGVACTVLGLCMMAIMPDAATLRSLAPVPLPDRFCGGYMILLTGVATLAASILLEDWRS